MTNQINPETFKKLEESMKKMQDRINAKVYKGQSGGGLVEASVNGKGDIVGVSINIPSSDLQNAEDIKTLSDLVVAAIKKAQDTAATSMIDNMGSIFGDGSSISSDINELLDLTKNLTSNPDFNLDEVLQNVKKDNNDKK